MDKKSINKKSSISNYIECNMVISNINKNQIKESLKIIKKKSLFITSSIPRKCEMIKDIEQAENLCNSENKKNRKFYIENSDKENLKRSDSSFDIEHDYKIKSKIEND